MGQRHLPIPWARLKYDRTLGGYQLDLTDEELARAPTFAADKDSTGRPQPRSRHNFYKVRPYKRTVPDLR
jgi:hypothetical protein